MRKKVNPAPFKNRCKVKVFSVIFIICLIILGGVLIFKYSFQPEPVQSASTDNVSGWAWTDTISWISFNCTDRDICAASNYGVNIDEDGDFSGYAWSENIGWINFAPTGPYPVAPNYSVNYDSDTDKVNGWARAEAHGDGWDGWILLGKEAGGWSNQVVIDTETKELSGWAWGSDVVGWISFNCVDRDVCTNPDSYKVIANINSIPSVTCNDSETWAYCSDSRNPFLSWDYSDPDSNPQESYQLQIDNNSDFSSPEIDTGVVNSSTDTYHPAGTTLNWNTTYFWQIKVKDDNDDWSDWCSPNCSFTVPIHDYPSPDFTCSPSNPSALEPVQFTDQTVFDNGGNSWDWTFESAVPISSVLQNPIATFSDEGNWEVTLEATDNDGYMCPVTKTIDVSESLPEWIEVIPR